MDSQETAHDSVNSDRDSDEQNIWSSILKQVQTGSSSKLPSCKQVIVLGENEGGKTSLVAKMEGNEEPRKGSGLEYHHMLVRDEYRDEHTKLGVWVLDGDPFHRELLKFALNENTFSDTTILIVASMTTPWDIIDSLEKWAGILESEIKSRFFKSSPDELNSFKRRNLKRYQEYISPGDEIENLVNNSPVKNSIKPGGRSVDGDSIKPGGRSVDGDTSKTSINGSIDSGHDDIMSTSTSSNLPEGVLTHNLGLDIIVVISKTDFMSVLEKEHDYKEEAFDFIQQATRKFCLKYGASLFYVSAKTNKNCDLLYKYLVHRIYGLPFKTPALVVEKDALFIPSGWDSDKKIAILYENITNVSPDDPFNEVIMKPGTIKTGIGFKEEEVVAEDDQSFLSKMHSQLNQNVPNSASVGSGAVGGATQSPSFRPSPGVQSKPDRRSVAGSVGSTPDGVMSKGSPGGEGVLQNFFNSLLNRKSGAGIPPSAGTSPRTPLNGSGASRTDVAAELDRLSNGPNSNHGSNPALNDISMSEVDEENISTPLRKSSLRSSNANQSIDLNNSSSSQNNGSGSS